MESEPKVSIVIPCFNRVDRTSECWRALEPSLPEERAVEVIFVDNGSTDGTSNFLSGLRGNSAVQVIRNAENLGFAKANNQGAAQARGEFLVFLNNDTVPLTGWLEPMIRVLENDPTAGLVGSKLLYPDGRVQHAGVIVREKIAGKSQLVCDHVHRLSQQDAPWVNIQREYQAITAACLAVRREVFHHLGGFDEAFVNGYEDVDFCFRARAAGLKVIYCPKSVLVHHESSTQGRKVFDEKNAALFSARWGERIRADEQEVYAAVARPNLNELRSELIALRASFEKIEASHPDQVEESDGVLRRMVLRWLGISKTMRRMQSDIRATRNTMLHLRRLTEGMAMLLDYYELERNAAEAEPAPRVTSLPRADLPLQ
jgi:GT2 family glycosyltransferase